LAEVFYQVVASQRRLAAWITFKIGEHRSNEAG